MIKKLRVTVDGKPFDVTVEVFDEGDGSAPSPASAPLAPASVAAPVSTPAPQPAATQAPVGSGDVASPLSGRVAAVVAQVGQEVKEGDHLITLEAMKMNTFVFAPRSGKVAEICTTVGAAVEEGQVLARLS